MEAVLAAAVRLAAPILLAAIGELVVERAGVVNIGVEGLMLVGAFAAFAVAVAAGSPGPAIPAAMAAAMALSTVFAWFAIVRRSDQIVVGMAVNLLALGLTGLGFRAFYAGAVPEAPAVPGLAVPGLAALPGIGPVLFQQTPFVYAALALACGVGLALGHTRPGLALRAVGEHARAADAEGVHVTRVRVVAVLFGAALAGLAGSVLTLAHSNTFTEGMTAGRGFIALAAVIFGRWLARGAVFAALFFGLGSALQFRLQARGLRVPYPVFLMLPYLLTLVVLALAAGRARAPAELGRPYARESP
jgi:simple sugar transport system permease protein